MTDPFWLIVAVIAIATVILLPLRLWQRSRRRSRDEPGGEPVPLAPPDSERRR